MTTEPTDTIGIGEAADMLGVHPVTLRRWANSGEIGFVQLTPRSPRRFFIADVLAMLDRSYRSVDPKNGTDAA